MEATARLKQAQQPHALELARKLMLRCFCLNPQQSKAAHRLALLFLELEFDPTVFQEDASAIVTPVPM